MTHMTLSEAHAMLQGLIREHGLFGWTIRFGYAKRTAGLCDHQRQVITLSKYLMAQRSYEDTAMTITHEVAHALTPGHGHDYTWQRQHKALGGNGKRCFVHVDEKAPIIGDCGAGCTISRYRAPDYSRQWKCKRHRRLVNWTDNRKAA